MAGAMAAGEGAEDFQGDRPEDAAFGAERASGRPEHAGYGERTGDGLSGAGDDFGLGPTAVPAMLAPGIDLGGVTLLRLIGEGGMGRVYEGRQRSPDRPVAVKVMRDVFASEATLRRFEHEAGRDPP